MGGKGTDGAWVKQDQSRAGIAETGCACVLCDEIGHVCVALGAHSYPACARIFHDKKLK